MSRHVVARAEDIPAGQHKALTVKGRPIVVFNLNGEFFGLLDRCPHQGAALSRGHQGGIATAPEPGCITYTRMGEFIRCPWHGWEYDIKTGKSWCDPSRIGTRTYPVKVAPGGDLVEGPFVAETIPVSVDDAYVVVEL